MPLTPEETKAIGAAMTDHPITIKLGDKETQMPYLEALIAWNRYAPQGNIETLAMATLLLKDRTAFEKKYMKAVETSVTKEFVQKHKYDAGQKAGQIKVETSKKTPTTQATTWRLKMG
jgi:predicted aminopeptidase